MPIPRIGRLYIDLSLNRHYEGFLTIRSTCPKRGRHDKTPVSLIFPRSEHMWSVKIDVATGINIIHNFDKNHAHLFAYCQRHIVLFLASIEEVRVEKVDELLTLLMQMARAESRETSVLFQYRCERPALQLAQTANDDSSEILAGSACNERGQVLFLVQLLQRLNDNVLVDEHVQAVQTTLGGGALDGYGRDLAVQ